VVRRNLYAEQETLLAEERFLAAYWRLGMTARGGLYAGRIRRAKALPKNIEALAGWQCELSEGFIPATFASM